MARGIITLQELDVELFGSIQVKRRQVEKRIPLPDIVRSSDAGNTVYSIRNFTELKGNADAQRRNRK